MHMYLTQIAQLCFEEVLVWCEVNALGCKFNKKLDFWILLRCCVWVCCSWFIRSEAPSAMQLLWRPLLDLHSRYLILLNSLDWSMTNLSLMMPSTFLWLIEKEWRSTGTRLLPGLLITANMDTQWLSPRTQLTCLPGLSMLLLPI